MLVFARRIGHPLDVPVDHPHHIRAHLGGPPCSATSNASIAACHSSASCSALGSLVMYVAASRRAPRSDRQTLIPRHELHLPLIGGATREYGTGSKHFSKILTSWTRSSCGGRL